MARPLAGIDRVAGHVPCSANSMHPTALVKTGLCALRSRVTGARVPLNVMLAVTNRCNATCAYCAIYEGPEHTPHTQRLLTLIDQLADAGTRRLGLWGGEPLLRDDVGQLIDAAKRRGIYVTLDTNGYLLKRRLDAVKRADHVIFSFDGVQPAHDANREPGAWHKVSRAMNLAAREGIPFWTLTVISKHNVDSLDAVLRNAERYGVQAMFQVLHHTEALDGGRGDALQPGNDQVRGALRWLRAQKAAGRPVANTVPALQHLEQWPDYRTPTSAHALGPTCLAAKVFCNIDADGRLQPCSLIPGAAPPNVFDHGFQAAWDALERPDCRSCSATAFTEYSLAYGLNPRVALEWARSLAAG